MLTADLNDFVVVFIHIINVKKLQCTKMLIVICTLCLRKKVPTFKLSVNWQILTDFQNFCTVGKLMKFATKLT